MSDSAFEFICEQCNSMVMPFKHAVAHIKSMHSTEAARLIEKFDLAIMEHFSKMVRNTTKGMI